MESAGQCGYSQAYCNLARFYDAGEYLPEDADKALHFHSLAAEMGNMQSQYDLGVIYYEGELVSQDFKKAFQCFDRASKQGHPDAYFNLGVMYAEGDGVEVDLARSYAYIKFAELLGANDTDEALIEIRCELNQEDLARADFFFKELGQSSSEESEDWD